jgi:hypothetical protein
MVNANTNLMFVGLFVVSGLWAGCAWDNSPPPYHSVISFDPSRAHTYVSVVPAKNAPSIRDWKADENVGIDYGSEGYGAAGPSAAPTASQAVGGAISTPSGASSGGAAGTTSPGSGTPGTIIGTSPSAQPITTPSPITTSPSISPPPSPGVNSTLSSPTYPTFSTPSPTGLTNTSSGVFFTNRFTAPTNTLLNPALNTVP